MYQVSFPLETHIYDRFLKLKQCVCVTIDRPKGPFQLQTRRKQTEQVPDVANAASAQRLSLKRAARRGADRFNTSLAYTCVQKEALSFSDLI